jgi:hypothetical protein
MDRVSLDATMLSIMAQASGLATLMLMMRELHGEEQRELTAEELQGMVIAYRYHYQVALDLMLEAMREAEAV